MMRDFSSMTMTSIHITDIEAAINFWRAQVPAPDGVALSAAVQSLAEVYGVMAYQRRQDIDAQEMPTTAMQAWLEWYASTPDTPCIAICSTSQGDAVCKGCGRSFEEVQHWTQMPPAEKRSVWRRITLDGTALRFHKYAERAGGAGAV
jgi:predicted Fe-S protein YdhL (DUF1289 family)